jgi:hypothetical protein
VAPLAVIGIQVGQVVVAPCDNPLDAYILNLNDGAGGGEIDAFGEVRPIGVPTFYVEYPATDLAAVVAEGDTAPAQGRGAIASIGDMAVASYRHDVASAANVGVAFNGSRGRNQAVILVVVEFKCATARGEGDGGVTRVAGITRGGPRQSLRHPTTGNQVHTACNQQEQQQEQSGFTSLLSPPPSGGAEKDAPSIRQWAQLADRSVGIVTSAHRRQRCTVYRASTLVPRRQPLEMKLSDADLPFRAFVIGGPGPSSGRGTDWIVGR